MKMIMAKSQNAQDAYKLVRALQKRFADKLSALSSEIGQNKAFEEVTWLRDEGLHGGGSRFESRDSTLFNTGSVNVSQVHYDDKPEKLLSSATAISTIIHPKNPHVPSVHIHISLTEMRDGSAYWRVMADLNPSVQHSEDKVTFDNALRDLAGRTYTEGKLQGEKYFDIPALSRKRGVSHFYLENYFTADKEQDALLAQSFGEGIIDAYINIITLAFEQRKEISEEDKQTQVDYHTLYLFQVLTLDRGTTSGLLVHSQNDVGIMGSLPTHINKGLLLSWTNKVQIPQDELVKKLVNVIGEDGAIDVPTKEKLAQVVREHYTTHKEALSLQASGNSIPPTVRNHKA
ncbi:MAG TPA: coproporphyrinogen III oxidase [Sulfurimonas sp.]|nr:coproporphyrinogen III oxidase [Sulfurimonas sp.]